MLDKKHKDIKASVKKCYMKIKEADEFLKHLRKECSHPEIESVNYAWAPGHIQEDTKVCAICGEVMPTKDFKYIINYDND